MKDTPNRLTKTEADFPAGRFRVAEGPSGRHLVGVIPSFQHYVTSVTDFMGEFTLL